MADISFQHISYKVGHTIGKLCLTNIVEFLDTQDLSLWGAQQPRLFEVKSLYISIYKDLTGIGYKELSEGTKLWHKIADKTLRHNCQLLRELRWKWGKRKIIKGEKKNWDDSSENVRKPAFLKKVNLWMDSFDIALRVKAKRSDDNWSFKCNSKGIRFQAILDGESRFRGLYGGYSLKLYEVHWVDANRHLWKCATKGQLLLLTITIFLPKK